MVRKKWLRDHGGYSVAPARFQVSVIRQLPGTVLEKAAERLWLHPIFTCQLDKIRRKTSSGLLLVPLFCRRTAARRKGKTSLIPADKRGFFVGAGGGTPRLRAGRGAALMCPRHIIHSRALRVPIREICKTTGPADGGACHFGDPYGTRTHVTAVKGRCLNHLTNGPYKRRSRNCCAFIGSGTWI